MISNFIDYYYISPIQSLFSKILYIIRHFEHKIYILTVIPNCSESTFEEYSILMYSLREHAA